MEGGGSLPGLVYDGNVFSGADGKPPCPQRWYPIGVKSGLPLPVNVTFKGVTFSLNGIQEVYDPDTQSLYVFTNWGWLLPWYRDGHE